MPAEALRYDLTPVGLHYLLIHYDIPDLDRSTWRLRIGGAVRRPLELRLDDLRRRPRATSVVTLECAGNGRARLVPRPISQPWLLDAVGTAAWTGTPLAPLLAEAGIRPSAVEVAFTGADHGIERGVEQDYARALPLGEALDPGVLLAYEMNGMPLPPQHGWPLRLVVPGWYGMAQVKWLTSITVLDQPFTGFQNAVAYRLKQGTGPAGKHDTGPAGKHDTGPAGEQETDDPGEPVTRILPRALMIPPGYPDFMSRTRFVHPGEQLIQGRAWSGWAPVDRVEVSTDGGATWVAAALGPALGRYAWRSWAYRWSPAAPGEYELLARATDEAGNCQPVEQPWNRQGMANNMVQRVRVVVTG
jgi:DMSO/TMAO reductase YedYZ molybdopterin-dependent catalytic subunit